jgi:hypothetical protein
MCSVTSLLKIRPSRKEVGLGAGRKSRYRALARLDQDIKISCKSLKSESYLLNSLQSEMLFSLS